MRGVKNIVHRLDKDVIEELPLLKKIAQGREISGLNACEQQGEQHDFAQ
jgi:hypothetical protein